MKKSLVEVETVLATRGARQDIERSRNSCDGRHSRFTTEAPELSTASYSCSSAVGRQQVATIGSLKISRRMDEGCHSVRARGEKRLFFQRY